MENRKVWKLLECLSEGERRRFQPWLAAELGETQQYLQQLSEALLDAYPKPPERAKIWQRLYPNQDFNDARLRKLTRDLSRWLEEFLAIETFREEKDQRDLYVLKALLERRQKELFGKQIRKMDKELEERKVRDSLYFRLKYELEYLDLEYEVAFREAVNRSFLEEEDESFSAQRTQDQFDKWWVYEKLNHAAINIANQQISGKKIHSFLLDETLEGIKSYPALSNSKILEIFSRMYSLFLEEKNEDVNHLLELLEKNQTNLSKDTLHSYWVLLINFFVRDLRETGNLESASKISDLFDWAINAGFLLIDGNLPEVYYKNMITSTLRAKKFNVALERLHEYKSLLQPERQEEAYNFGLGNYLFAIKDYKAVIRLISPIQFSNPRDEIYARSNLLHALYETEADDFEWLLSQIENIQRYIRTRPTISKSNKQAYQNRFRLFKQLIKAYSQKDLLNLKERINQTFPLDQKEWLLSKVEERLSSSSFQE